MFGSLLGDMIGSCYEGKKCIFDDTGSIIALLSNNGKAEKISRRELISNESHITDDSVLTLATADALLDVKNFARKYIDYFVMTSSKGAFYRGHGIGYGAKFLEWADYSDREGVIRPPYHSYGNGAAMRVSPVAYAAKTVIDVLNVSLESCLCTHNTPSAIKSAQAVALTIWLARAGWGKEEILEMLKDAFEYDLDFSFEQLVQTYTFNPTADGSVPVALYLALTSDSFIDTMVRCLKVGGDTDTIACIAGGIAEPLFGIPEELASAGREVLERDSPFLLDKYLYFSDKLGTLQPVEVKKSWIKRLLKR